MLRSSRPSSLSSVFPMDKKNTVIGVLLLIAAMASFYFSARLAPPVAPSGNPPAGTSIQPTGLPTTASARTQSITSPNDAVLSAAKVGPAEYVTLSNDFITVQFTNRGGAIHQVGLKKYLRPKARPPFTPLILRKLPRL